MKRTGTYLLSIGAAALLALGCNSGAVSEQPDPEDLGTEVVVQFNEGESTTIHLRSVAIQEDATGAKQVTAEMLSDLPDTYSVHATIRGAQDFEILLHNGNEISHAVNLSGQALAIEFMRPTWERSETLGFMSKEVMNEWLQARIDSGAASCNTLPERFQDLPLQYATSAILGHLVSEHGLAIDVARLDQLLCAQAADAPERNSVEYPRELAGWDALRRGEYMPSSIPEALPPLEGDLDAEQAKNNCARDIKTASVAGTYDTQTQGTVPTNIELSCGDAVLELDSQCCIDTNFKTSQYGNLQQRTLDRHTLCNSVNTESGAPMYAQFAFNAHANVCPDTPNSCWGNGVRDTVVPHSCEFQGFVNKSGMHFEPVIGGETVKASGIAAWNYMNFLVRVCYEPGDGEDVIYLHNRSVDTIRPMAAICTVDNVSDCYCAVGP